MKVKNIAFSGFAAAILFSAGAANAAPQIASKAYVDNLNATTLETVENTYVKTTNLGDQITQNITNALADETSTLAQELAGKQDALTTAQQAAVDSGITADGVAQISTNTTNITSLSATVDGKEDSANKTGTITDENKASATLFPTVGAIVSWTNSEIAKLSEDGLPVNPENIQDGSISSDKLSAELNSTIDGKADKITVTAEQVGNLTTVDANGQYQVSTTKVADLATNAAVETAITEAVTADGGVIKDALDAKANAADVYTKTETEEQIKSLAVPAPTGACAAESGRCVLSYDIATKGIVWVDVTSPLGE